MEYGSPASCLLTACLFSSLLLSSSPALQQELLKPWQVLFLRATCCSFGSACLCLCVVIGCPSQSVHLCIFTWMTAYVGIFFSGIRRQTCTHNADPLVSFFNSQINILPVYVQTKFGCCFTCLGLILTCCYSLISVSLHLKNWRTLLSHWEQRRFSFTSFNREGRDNITCTHASSSEAQEGFELMLPYMQKLVHKYHVNFFSLAC